MLVADQLTKLINDLHAEDMLTKDSDDIRRALQSLELALVNNLVGTHDQIAPALSAIRGYIQIDQAAPEQSLFEPEGMFE